MATYPNRRSSSISLPSPIIGKKPSSSPITNRCLYSNPFEEPCEYLAICLPAFSIDSVNREDE